MKSILFFLVLQLLFSATVNAQFSFSNMGTVIEEENKRMVMNEVKDSLLNSEEYYSLGKKFKFSDFETELEQNSKGDKMLDTVSRNWFPARNDSKLSTVFFEGKMKYTQLFQNSNTTYNPKLKNMTFNTEVVNDYLGPLRIGIGFQFNSTVEEKEEEEQAEIDKNKLVSSLQNGGGNFFVNLKLPVLAIGKENSSFGLKSYLFQNTGIELTKFNEADENYVLTNNTGVAIGGYGMGYKRLISVFIEAKASILYGNSEFDKILSANETLSNVIPLLHFGFGMNFLDMYTLKADVYPAGEFVKKNFPATISFTITPAKK